ncbi:MAG: class I SAM-dependent methyltransferase [Christensenellaceae bacterium]|jgi:23S rRNA (cytosine1962-C5)-methyltransferase|nr:class I SAM-dependent methyltransferase [Christensenellaceae bacterium]
MKTTSNWNDYEIIASGGGEKLERWGDIFLLRPDPQAIWSAPFELAKYKDLHGHYIRSNTGGGQWKWIKKIPDEWTVQYNNLKFIISPTGFKHTGLFPEQASNWDKIVKACQGKSPTVLNLFGYTGGATVAAASAGAQVTHVDASKGMTDVCKRNCELNKLPNDRVRFIVDDCAKFVAREIRRGKTYDAVIMDPPSFGRGTGGEVWKLETDLEPLVDLCVQVLSKKPLFFLVNSYTTGLQTQVIKNVLTRSLAKSKIHANIDAYEIGLPTNEHGIELPAGASCFCNF